MPLRKETCYAETESCLLGINRQKLSILQKRLLDTGNNKDYFVLESLLKGNYLLKNQWRTDFANGKIADKIEGVTMHTRVEGTESHYAPNQSRRNFGKGTHSSVPSKELGAMNQTHGNVVVDRDSVYSAGVHFGNTAAAA